MSSQHRKHARLVALDRELDDAAFRGGLLAGELDQLLLGGGILLLKRRGGNAMVSAGEH